MAQNDNKIKELLTTIEAKKKQMGAKPKAAWKSNGLIKRTNELDKHININVINNINTLIMLTAEFISSQYHMQEAAKFLGVGYDEPTVADYLDDLKLRASMLMWDAENEKLKKLETQLKALRSEDLKTQDALSDIAKEL